MTGVLHAVVLASFGRSVLIEPADGIGAALHCSLKGRRQRAVCGDRITWSRGPEQQASLETIEPRRNLIERIDLRGRAEPVASNLDRLAIVVAPEPQPDWFLVDRYWAGAVLKDIEALLVVNKSDLRSEGVDREVAVYRGLGLTCLETAAHSGAGIDALAGMMRGRSTLLVGQSGVGKSSLVNALVPEAAAQTAELTRDAEGRHTTTTARRYRIASGTAIVDAPGVRDFAPPASLARAAQHGFVEIHAASVQCRFNDCRHFEEPGCAVRAALPGGGISARRYESYRRLLRLYEKLAP